MADVHDWKVGALVTVRSVNIPASMVWRVSSECHDEDGAAYMLERGRMYTWARADDMEAAPPGAVVPPVFRTEVLRAE